MLWVMLENLRFFPKAMEDSDTLRDLEHGQVYPLEAQFQGLPCGQGLVWGKEGPCKSVPENWGLSACGTTHEATSQISSGDRPHPEVRREAREPLADKAGESTHRSRSEGEKGLR